MSDDDSILLVARHPAESGGDIVVVTFNRPEAMNAMTVEGMPQLVDCLDGLATDSSVRVVILTGAGKAFSAGADLSAAMAIFQGDASPTSPQLDAAAAVSRLPMPVIAAVNGPAITGGFEVALAADIRIASPEASFVDTHATFGIHPCWGLSQRLQRLIGTTRAMHTSLASVPITGEQAERWGLVSQLVPAAELLPTALALAHRIADGHPAMARTLKALISDGAALPLGEARQMEQERAGAYYSSMTSEDFQKMAEFLMKKKRKKKKPAAKL